MPFLSEVFFGCVGRLDVCGREVLLGGIGLFALPDEGTNGIGVGACSGDTSVGTSAMLFCLNSTRTGTKPAGR